MKLQSIAVGAAAFAVVLSPALAATASPETAPDGPQLVAYAQGVRDAAHLRAMTVRRMDVSVQVRGAVAETTIDAQFANPLDETVEGEFRLALPFGAVVTGYALDVNGKLVDGVLVDRPRAKAVYDARVRRGVDPGLAEVTPANLFTTRVNPILPHQSRRVRLRFVAPVPLGGLTLPVAVAAAGEGWSTVVRHADSEVLRREGKAALEPIRVGRSEGPAVLASTHSTGERDVEIAGDLPAAPKASGPLRIYWDRSRARIGGDLAGAAALVGKLVDRSGQHAEIVAFNSSGAERRRVASGAEAVAWLGTLRYRGATSFAGLRAVKDATPAVRCVLFAEGGPAIDRAAGFDPSCRLDTVHATSAADAGWLRHLAAAHGGRDFALEAGDRLAGQLAAAQPGVTAVLDQDGKSLAFVALDEAPGRYRLLARAPEGGPVRIRFGDGEQVVRVPVAAPAFDGAGALIAADQLAALGATEQRADYVALSRRYSVASPSLSYLVLETPADYLNADIAPPASYPSDLRSAWASEFKARARAKEDAATGWRMQVARDWADTVAWWDKAFDPNAKPIRVTASKNFDRTTTNGAVPPPPPPPSPMVNAPAATLREEAAQDVVVTASRRTGEARMAASPVQAIGAAAKSTGSGEGAPAATIQIDPWQPDRPYLELFDGKPADFDERFLEAQARHGGLPIFYLDTAEWLRRHGRGGEAAEMVLSALALPTANEVTLAIVADRLERYGELDRAIELRERVAVLDTDRPQPRRLLALARRAAAEPKRAKADLTRAIELLYAIATMPQASEWRGIEMIALTEANALLPRLRKAGGTFAIDPRFERLLDSDMRVVIDWTTDGSDMDLWIDEPNGERAIYHYPRTLIGGHLSHDMTRGYGPEEYWLRKAPAGTFTVQANVFAPDRLDPNGETLVTAHLIRDFGRPTEHDEAVDVAVKRDERGSKLLGRIVFTPAMK